MRRAIGTISLSLSAFPLPSHALAQAPAASSGAVAASAVAGPSLQDTQAFLTEKIAAGDPRAGTIDTVVAWSGCTAIITRTVHAAQTGQFKITIKMQDVEGFRIEGETANNRQYYNLHFIDDSIAMDETIHQGKALPADGTAGFHQKINDFTINFVDHDLASRVAKAFAHAVILCGGPKKQPF